MNNFQFQCQWEKVRDFNLRQWNAMLDSLRSPSGKLTHPREGHCGSKNLYTNEADASLLFATLSFTPSFLCDCVK